MNEMCHFELNLERGHADGDEEEEEDYLEVVNGPPMAVSTMLQ